jgi:predicted Rossmann-fold nucleotide-binding protein
VRDYFDPLLRAIDHAVSKGFIFPEHRLALCCDSDPGTLLEAMEKHEHPHGAVKRWMRTG